MDQNAYLPPEVNVEPLGDLMLDVLIDHDNEESYLDFKETITIAKDSDFAKTAKDFFSFSNFGGGFLLLGFRPKDKMPDPTIVKRNFVPVGLPEDFRLDQAALQEKFNSYSPSPISIQYKEFLKSYEGSARRLAAVYIPGHTSLLKPVREGTYLDTKGKKHIAFRKDEPLFRRGTQSVPASDEEIAWIEKRAKLEGYRISILSGKPDEIQETIHSNLFEVVKLPQTLWSADPISDYKNRIFPPPGTAFKFWDQRIVTFSDLTEPNSPIAKRIIPESVREEQVQAWLDDKDKQGVIIELLNREMRLYAEGLHLQHEPNKEKFYFSCTDEFRMEKWKPRFKTSSTLKVAQRMWVQQVHKPLYWHLAVIARFTYAEGKTYLTLLPTIQLTDDGKRAVFGAKEGTAITRLTYNRYNSSFLNSVLFWAHKLSEGKDEISLNGGKIRILSKPVTSVVEVGILSDRPASETMPESPEIEVEEVK